MVDEDGYGAVRALTTFPVTLRNTGTGVSYEIPCAADVEATIAKMKSASLPDVSEMFALIQESANG